jgi:para-aminobenzoate synthetase component 1
LNLKDKLNLYGSKKIPFFFCISYDMSVWEVCKLSQLPKNIRFEINKKNIKKSNINFKKKPISRQKYKKKFDFIQKKIRQGDTYLANLTTSTKIKSKYPLKALYDKANARFKLYFKDKFICFSPERFVKCKNNKIYTYPMKGTIDVDIKNSKKKLKNDKKELAEHTMVVDLLRNDLSMVSKKVRVKKFRYFEKIEAGQKQLWQTSSKIQGDLKSNWQKNIGDILLLLLPAGSITGTPKINTVKILKDIEGYSRDYYTGIFGIFDGKNLDSAVMIRFIQKDKNNNLIYKSGGGITCDSNIDLEYQEMIDKIYLP